MHPQSYSMEAWGNLKFIVALCPFLVIPPWYVKLEINLVHLWPKDEDEMSTSTSRFYSSGHIVPAGSQAGKGSG